MSTEPSPNAVLAAAERIAGSPGFQGSEQLCRFLRYVVAETLAGRGGQLREYSIGVAVFDRPAGYNPTIDAVVRVQARQLRFKLAEYYAADGRNEPIEIAIPKGGYQAKFSSRVVAAPPVEVVEPVAAPAAVAVAAAPRVWGQRVAMIAVAMLAVGVVAVAVAAWPRRGAVEPVRSLVVLPFLNLTGSGDREYLSDGMTEELTTALANLPGLAVVARTTAFQFKDRPHDVREIGRRLKVNAVIEGSVRLDDSTIRVTVQLARASDGYHLWARNFQRSNRDLVAMQQDIAAEVVNALQGSVGTVTATPARRQLTGDHRAYVLFLEGRFFWNKRTPQALARAIALFDEAIGRDSSFALAHAGRAAVHATMSLNGVGDARAAARIAVTSAERALRIDPGLGEARATLGLMRAFADWDFEAAESELRRAIEQSPGYAIARYWYANTLTARGRIDEALEQLRLAERIDPLSLPIANGIGEALIYGRRWDEAIVQAKRMLDLDPSFRYAHSLISRAHYGAGRYPEAVAAARAAGDSLGALLIGVREGTVAKARALAAIAAAPGRVERPFIPAIQFAMVGEVDSAFGYLELAYRGRHPDVMSVLVEPALDPVRSDARYRGLVEKAGLVVP